ncbi:putative DNA-binding transcriptional regulator YafY [Lacinutrix venerupis]|uniref:helix-turn-helix transcriptional regulator n=1 Tax=Lacinutrix venerupis TaxID=1486034 RepID=UPI000EAD5A97|nr:WYL domain-containing protein [Lacinutrix venerupis]RLJ61603.1 putative DNA-binding transcriptional regulator YafY [Lacinutrix venerupis]
MSTNKHAIIRYQTLDKCFRNTGKRYYIEDLLEACNNALFDFDPNSLGIKKRQLYDDVRFMESSQGWSIPLEKVKDGRRAYYHYEDDSFSINNQPLNDNEAEQIKSAMLVLGRFKGLPQFEWVNELIPKLDQTFNLSSQNQEIISFDTNEFLIGAEYISTLFKAIQNKQSLIVTYKSFKSIDEQKINFHPYHLKQYNNRWFVFGKNDGFDNLTNLALDRIKSIDHSSIKFDTSQMIDFEEFFEDIIGVTKPDDVVLTKIILKATPQLAPYIITKPLHGSQKNIEETESFYTFSIEVIPNYELNKKILSFGNGIQVLEPTKIREAIKEELAKTFEKYN